MVVGSEGEEGASGLDMEAAGWRVRREGDIFNIIMNVYENALIV